MIYNYLGIFILIIIILFIINYFLKSKEYFKSNPIFSKEYILENCKNNYAKINSISSNNCKNEAWVTNPRLLCGICGDKNIALQTIYPSSGSTNPNFYGCLPGQSNQLGINWSNNATGSADEFLGEILTCNKTNKGITADLILVISSTEKPIITVNGATGTPISLSFLGNSFYYCYYYPNITYDTQFNLSITSASNNGCISFSYFWNKQIFILEKNGYQNCCNLIKYYINNKMIWVNSNSISNLKALAPWMSNWMMMDTSNKVNNLSINFKIGHVDHVGRMNNDLVIWMGATSYGELNYNNGQQIFGNISNLWGNSVLEFTIPNVKNGDTLDFSTQSPGFRSTSLVVTFIYHGLLFSTTTSFPNFNSVTNNLGGSNTISYPEVQYCDLPYIYEGDGPCNGCPDNNDSLCVLEYNYYNACNFQKPIDNLFFNKDWLNNNASSPNWTCECCGYCSDNGNEYCCGNYALVCNQWTELSFSVTINDQILPQPTNYYV